MPKFNVIIEETQYRTGTVIVEAKTETQAFELLEQKMDTGKFNSDDADNWNEWQQETPVPFRITGDTCPLPEEVN